MKKIKAKIAEVMDKMVRKTATFKKVDGELMRRLDEIKGLNSRVAELDRELLTNYTRISRVMCDLEAIKQVDIGMPIIRVIMNYDLRAFPRMGPPSRGNDAAAGYIGRSLGHRATEVILESLAKNTGHAQDTFSPYGDEDDEEWGA